MLLLSLVSCFLSGVSDSSRQVGKWKHVAAVVVTVDLQTKPKANRSVAHVGATGLTGNLKLKLLLWLWLLLLVVTSLLLLLSLLLALSLAALSQLLVVAVHAVTAITTITAVSAAVVRSKTDAETTHTHNTPMYTS